MADADWWRPHQPTRRRGRNNRPIVLEAAAGGTGGYPIRAHLSASRDVSGSCAYLVVLSTGDLQRLGFFFFFAIDPQMVLSAQLVPFDWMCQHFNFN